MFTLHYITGMTTTGAACQLTWHWHT